jgi:tetraacyldisaccharide 4'-kinase
MTAPCSATWHHTLREGWTRRGVLAWSFWPVSLLFGGLVRLRQMLYRLGWFKSEGVPVPLVVVGNVVVGGVGKTPVVMALVQHWQARGIAVGVISRGYGRRTQGCMEVTPNSTALQVGDEPALIRKRTGAPVFVAARRIDAARALLAAYPKTRLIVSDDGLQHLALRRNLEIGVFDDRGVGNGWLLPAGPLREPWPRQLDLVLHTGTHPAFEGFKARRELDTRAYRADGGSVALADLALASSRPLMALAAIAQPEIFFEMLRGKSVHPDTTLSLPDHYDFDSNKVIIDNRYELICTEKDAVKLWATRPDAWAVPLICKLPDVFWCALDARTSSLLTPPR